MTHEHFEPIVFDRAAIGRAIDQMVAGKSAAKLDEYDLQDLRARVIGHCEKIGYLAVQDDVMELHAVSAPAYVGDNVSSYVTHSVDLPEIGRRLCSAVIIEPQGGFAAAISTADTLVQSNRRGLEAAWQAWRQRGVIDMGKRATADHPLSRYLSVGAEPELIARGVEIGLKKSLRPLLLWGLRSLTDAKAAKLADIGTELITAELLPAAMRMTAKSAAALAVSLDNPDTQWLQAAIPSATVGHWNAFRSTVAPGVDSDKALIYRRQFVEGFPGLVAAWASTAPDPHVVRIRTAVDSAQSLLDVFRRHVPDMRKAILKTIAKMQPNTTPLQRSGTGLMRLARTLEGLPPTLPVKDAADLSAIIAMGDGLDAISEFCASIGSSNVDLLTTCFKAGWAQGAKDLAFGFAPDARDHAEECVDLHNGYAREAMLSVNQMRIRLNEHLAAMRLYNNFDTAFSDDEIARGLFAAMGLKALAQISHQADLAMELQEVDRAAIAAQLELPDGCEWTPLISTLPREVVVGEYRFVEMPNAARLSQESDIMTHCIGTHYGNRTRRQGYRPFAVVKGETSQSGFGTEDTRGTANFMVAADGRGITLEMVKAKRNREVSQAMHRATSQFITEINLGMHGANLGCFARDTERLQLLEDQCELGVKRAESATIDAALAVITPPQARQAGLTLTGYLQSQQFRELLTAANERFSREAVRAASEGPNATEMSPSFG